MGIKWSESTYWWLSLSFDTSHHHTCWTLFVQMFLFSFYKECSIKHFTGQIVYNDRWSLVASCRAEHSYLVQSMNWLYPHYKPTTPGLWSALLFPIRGPLLHVHVRKSSPLLGETSPVNPVANSFFSTVFELELYLSFTRTASLQSASLECCANESEAAHVLWWRRECVQYTTVGVLQAHRIPAYCCLPCTLDCLITIRLDCQVYFLIRIRVPMWPWPQWPEAMLWIGTV